MAAGGDFELPEALLEMLPKDPYQLLDLASKITSMAVASRVSKLDIEMRKLRQKLAEKDHLIHSLQGHNQELEKALEVSSSRLSSALNEQAKLATEKKSLTSTVKRLSRSVQKLETFKKTLMESLQDEDDNLSFSQNDDECLDNNQHASAFVMFPKESSLSNQVKEEDISQKYSERAEESDETSDEEGSETDDSGQRIPPSSSQGATPCQMTSAPTPAASPKRQSSVVSPRFSSHSEDFRFSPPGESLPGQTARLDGKEFFRQARSRLSYEQFSAFLNNIKELNSHRRTKEEALHKAEEIFGPDNQDLYRAFDGLLSHHLPS